MLYSSLLERPVRGMCEQGSLPSDSRHHRLFLTNGPLMAGQTMDKSTQSPIAVSMQEINLSCLITQTPFF